ncbi:hypothetical protein IFM89_015049 [Coptis chinensis]|uniref:Uncharacterized protein n=1 Tax=Coptis chinensis TaxID=261450 RepID=A0A835LEF2_9MAGN|nr:hypothetical protein IFM89_015049 [Coptis chinensis]
MQNVVVSIKSIRVAITDDEFFSSCNETESDYGDLLTEDVELALKIDSSESVPENGISDGFIAHRHSVYLVDGENRKPSPRHKKICFLLEVHFVWRRRVLVTFTKFEELQPLDEFSTPPLSPSSAAGNQSQLMQMAHCSSWVRPDKSPYELLNLLNNIDMHMVALYTENMDMHMRAFVLIPNHPDSILNSLTEIKEVGQDGKETPFDLPETEAELVAGIHFYSQQYYAPPPDCEKTAFSATSATDAYSDLSGGMRDHMDVHKSDTSSPDGSEPIYEGEDRILHS